VRSLRNFTVHQIDWSDKIKGIWDWVEHVNCIHNLIQRILKGIGSLLNLSVDDRMILKWILTF